MNMTSFVLSQALGQKLSSPLAEISGSAWMNSPENWLLKCLLASHT